MSDFSDQELWEYIREDLPYFDMTTHLLSPPFQKAILSIITRDEIMMACGNSAARMAELLGCEVKFKAESGTLLSKNSLLLEIEGSGESLHKAWRICQVFLEYSCGLATNAYQMLEKVRCVNPSCEVLVTRKSFPFAKRFSILALMVGGVMPHRLGLSESILIFDHHRVMYETNEAFEAAFCALKKRCVENKLVVESKTVADAKRMLKLGADVIQLDKCDLELISEIVYYKNKNFPHAKIVAAGGVNMQNATRYAETGVDAVVTSSLYKAAMSDLTSSWKKV